MYQVMTRSWRSAPWSCGPRRYATLGHALSVARSWARQSSGQFVVCDDEGNWFNLGGTTANEAKLTC